MTSTLTKKIGELVGGGGEESRTGNGLSCFTNCLLAMEDGSLFEKDLWIDTTKGIIIDSQVRPLNFIFLDHQLIDGDRKRSSSAVNDRVVSSISAAQSLRTSIHLRMIR